MNLGSLGEINVIVLPTVWNTLYNSHVKDTLGNLRNIKQSICPEVYLTTLICIRSRPLPCSLI